MKFCPNYTVAASTSMKTSMVTVYISSQQSRKKQQHNKARGFPGKDYGLHRKWRMGKEKGVVEEREEGNRMQDMRAEGREGYMGVGGSKRG